MRAGDEAVVDGLCGVQFAAHPIRVRLIKVLPYVTVGPDLVWVHVYELTLRGEASRDRELLVVRSAFEQACATGVTHRARRVPSIPRQRVEVSRVDA